MASPIPPVPSSQLETVLRYIDAFKDWNVNEIVATTSDEYTHYVLPKSSKLPVRNKQQFTEVFQALSRLFTSFNVVIEEIIESPGKILIHASSVGTTATGAPYANEYNLTFHVKDDASGYPVISCVKEFVDSKYTTDFFLAERERRAEQGNKEGFDLSQ